MKLETPKNINYCATVVKIENVIPLENCDFVVGTSIMGNQVIVGKDIQIGEIGLYFPVEAKLSEQYLGNNNLYKDVTLNMNPSKKGYFELNGRIRCVKFKGHKSEGLFMPIDSLMFAFPPDPKHGYGGIGFSDLFELGESFDTCEGIEICSKYVPKSTKNPNTQGPGKKGKGRMARESKLIPNQFRFHDDTSQLFRNLHMIHPDDLISITYKIHGTSFISSNILCKKALKWYEKFLIKLGIHIVDTEYSNLYSSRRVIKNSEY